jgi:hypothetical protein
MTVRITVLCSADSESNLGSVHLVTISEVNDLISLYGSASIYTEELLMI